MAETGFERWSEAYRQLSPNNRRTSVIYVLNVVYTSLALGLQFAGSPSLSQHYTLTGVHCAKLAAVVVSGLYLFELAYRDSLRFPMLVHHFPTLFAILFVISVNEKTDDPTIIVTGLLWLFQATTEQSVFIGLLMCQS